MPHHIGAEKSRVRTRPNAEAAPLTHSPSDAARVVGCGRSAIYRAMSSGSLKARKLGRRTMILDEDLRTWLSALPVRSPASPTA